MNKVNNSGKDAFWFLLGVGLFILCLGIAVFLITSNKTDVSFECNSGKISMDLFVNETNFSHFQLKEIDGLTCKGSASWPLGWSK